MDSYTIVAVASSNGGITPSGSVSVSCSGTQTFTFTPATCYEIDMVLIDGINNPTAVTEGEYTFEDVTADHYIDAIGPDAVNEYENKSILFTLQPNPAQNYVEIVLYSSELSYNKEVIQIYDVQGLLLKTVPLYNEKTLIDISTLAKGFYIVKIGNEAKKLIVN
jgi:hypothetical protein